MTGDVRLEDAEYGGPREVTVTPALLRAYRARLDARVQLVRDAAHGCGGTHLAVGSDTDIESLLLGQLKSGGMVQ